MSRLVLVRHGETIWHEDNRYAGRSDIALTDRGVIQAERLALWAAGAGLRAVWSSPLSRAVRTATPAAVAAGTVVQIDPRLIELDFGRGEGRTEAEMRAEFPQERTAFVRAPTTNWLPGGEDPAIAALRAMEALRELARGEGRVLVVTHNTLLRLVLCEVLGVPLDRYRTVFPSLKNGALTELDFSKRGIGLLTFNVPLEKDWQESPYGP
jgi:probable phosphoglycerate mutase